MALITYRVLNKVYVYLFIYLFISIHVTHLSSSPKFRDSISQQSPEPENTLGREQRMTIFGKQCGCPFIELTNPCRGYFYTEVT